MKLDADQYLQEVAEFMQQRIPASALVSVAAGLKAIAPLLWGHYSQEPITPLRLRNEPISACDPHTQSSSSECQGEL